MSQKTTALHSALIGTYEYDMWGKTVGIKEASAGIDTDGILTKNPIRYRSYYFDNETGFYNLNQRYYDPEIRRFISADSMSLLMVATTSINCKNLFNYCENNPVNGKDSSGAVIETPFDLVTLGISVIDVCKNPADPWAWAGLVGDAVDLIPCVSGVGEAVKGAKCAVKYGDEIGGAVIDVIRTVGKKLDDAVGSLKKAKNSKKVYFGQKSVSPNFSSQGIFKGASIQSVVDKLIQGDLSADNLPIEYIVRDGKMITMNNRSLTALSKANMKPTVLIDVTGDMANELKLTQRLAEMGGQPSESIIIRKIGEIVQIPE